MSGGRRVRCNARAGRFRNLAAAPAESAHVAVRYNRRSLPGRLVSLLAQGAVISLHTATHRACAATLVVSTTAPFPRAAVAGMLCE